ncbi:trigger factor [Candidatus Saccharibacteria bacterium]|nr:MAG: trigger factor [Candidatus Saccharibacteria bacterium]PID99301.1 MAG: trigger factor [Candidatus Saccharibacteria bacterium]
MQITKKQLDPTHIQLNIAAGSEELEPAKEAVLKELSKEVKLSGFRKGHAPTAMVEKVVDQQLLTNRIIDRVVNDLYVAAVQQERVRAVAQPEVNLTKFVPYTALELTAKIEAVGDITLPDYKKFAVKKQVEAVTDKEVEHVIDELLERGAEKTEVKRAAADGDEVTMNFAGVDAKTKKEIAGAKGDDYPLVLGSGAFIPGFEPELVGLKAGEEKTFTVTFPKDYGVADMQGKKVEFTVTVKAVKKRKLPKLDNAFAAKLGPFKTVAELRGDIRKQIASEKDNQAQQKLENSILDKLGAKTQVAIPDSLIEQEIDLMEEDEKRNALYRGQTWQEHLAAEGKTEEEHREGHREQASLRIKTGIALGEVAEKEGVSVSEQERADRLAALKKQYSDKNMQAELEKPENQRDVYNRMLTEKTIAALVSYATK